MSKNVKGLEKLIKALENVTPNIQPKVNALVEINAQDIVADAKRKCPVDNGDLEQSIGSERISDNTFRVATNMTKLAPYGAVVEYGSAPHVIKPKNGGYLKFKIGDKWIYTKEVNHPGTRAQPFFFPAVFKGRAKFTEDIEKLVDKEIKKL